MLNALSYPDLKRILIDNPIQRGWWQPSLPTTENLGGIYGGSALNPNSTDIDSNGRFYLYQTDGTANDITSVSLGSATRRPHQPRWNPFSFCKFALEDTSNVRFRMGHGSASGTNTFNDDNPSGQGYFLRFSTGVPDTNFMFEIEDNSTLVSVDTGIPADTAVHYFFCSSTSTTITLELRDANFKLEKLHIASIGDISTSANCMAHYGVVGLTTDVEGFKLYKVDGGNLI